MSEVKIHAQEVEQVPLADLKPYDKNARTHDDAQVSALVGMIREAGFTAPLLIDGDNRIIAGHGRSLAAAKLEMETVPVIRVLGLSDDQVKALRIADNQLGLRSGWNFDLLKAELLDLRAIGFDLSVTGFGADELAEFFKPKGGARGDPEFTPRAPATPISALGDVWLMDRHRVVCGDSTDPAVVKVALDGQTPHLMVTDPPYGVDYDPDWRNDALRVNTHRTGTVQNDGRVDWREAWKLFPGEVAYVWFGGQPQVGLSLEAVGFQLRYMIIWNKPKLVPGRGHYHFKHEPCWYAVKKGATGHWAGGRKQSTVWDIANRDQDAKTAHGTQKPVECMKRPIENNSKAGDRVYEPFLGSGTTLIAAHTTKRVCHGIELDPVYVDVAVTRWEGFTGSEARLESTGQTFAEVKAERTA